MDRIEDFSEYCDRTFDVVSLIEVLHHVRKPVEVIHEARKLVSDGGIIVVKVPNDFNNLQEVIVSEKKLDRWWVNPPMIINYFNHKSLNRLLHREGLEVCVSYSDFPMEIFLLMGDDYVSGQASGEDCHRKRVLLEKLVPNELRRKVYKMFAKFGFGRNVTCIAKKSAL
jgi:SAM-dependent methyltransferase